jgi:CHAT domain-containing protein
LRSPAPNAEVDKQTLARKLYGQRLAPLEPHLRTSAKLPAVQRLIVVPAGWMNAIPVEALTDRYTVSYAPSGTVFARLQEQRQQAAAKDRQASDYRLLAVGDPVFALPPTPSQPEPPPPDHGVLITLVTPDSNAARGGLQPGDVVLRYAGAKLAAPADLAKAISQSTDQPSAGQAGRETSVAVQVWRQGQVLDLKVRPGRLGIGYSQKAAADEIRARREGDAAVRGGRGKVFPRLPGTRREVEALAPLFPHAETLTLLGSEASEQRLEELAAAGRLRQFRVLHFATHGDMNDQMAMQSALILAQDRLPDPLPRATAGLKPYDGRLTAAQILKTWKLDADLVTLSACETGLGKNAGGEGYLGFSQVLFLAGARSLLLSLWSVQDQATALLMTRFYENLLGKRTGLDKPLPKAEALREAKHWLRTLPQDEVDRLAAGLASGVRARTRDLRQPAQSGSLHPYEDPYYWAGFILIGDPD